jgi:hypothetical protein
MLAYVFWHHPAAGVDAIIYEEALRAFHSRLTGSAAFAFRDVPWFPASSGYLDWYTVEDFASLGALNEAAVTGARKEPHDNVASMAGAGFGGLYRLIAGQADLTRTNTGTWLRKPDGMKYASFLEQALRLVNPSSMGLWQRQMSLGPGLEFCFLGADRIDAPEAFSPVSIELRKVWS